MNCENRMCVYWEADQCTMDNIAIDTAGRCADCLFIPIEEDYLQVQRVKFLRRLDDDLAEILGYRGQNTHKPM